MNLIIVFIALVAACGSTASTTPQQRFKFDLTLLTNIINLIIDPLKKIDPISVEDYQFDLFGLHFKINDAHLEGFSNILTDIHLDVNYPTTSLNLAIQLPKSFGSVQLWETNFPIVYGKGNFSYMIQNAQLVVKISYKFFNGFEPTVFKPSVESANFTITGVNNNEAVSQQISVVLNTLFNDVLNDSRIHDAIASTIDMILNDLLPFPIKKSN